MAQLKMFNDIEKNKHLKQQMIGVAVAAGTVAAFGTPFAGIIAAIELTATFFIVGNLWKCFFCCCLTLIAIKYLQIFKHVALFSMTNYSVIPIDYEIFFFVILGVISAYIAILFNFVMMKMVFLRVKLRNPYVINRWKWSATVAFLIALMSFPIPQLRYGDRRILNILFSEELLEKSKDAHIWTEPNIAFNLVVYVTIKFIINMLSLSVQIPAGAFGPAFALGAGFGRLYGYLLKEISLQIFGFSLIKNSGIYSIVGAVAVSGAITKQISPAIIILEITGQSSFIVPVFLGTLISLSIFNQYCMSIFDVMMDFKAINYLPALGTQESYSYQAHNIMSKNFMYLTLNSTLSDLAVIIQKIKRAQFYIPVVESEINKLLLYNIKADSLITYLYNSYFFYQDAMNQQAKLMLDHFMYQLKEITLNHKEYSKHSFYLDPLQSFEEMKQQQGSLSKEDF